ncbi:DUF4249 family protein [uncultured Acetobacteroides sp.]|uniref:DUF4249 family protein n=1 Tax=uncultured Acetobacteroides sp. TaxID=1760811 RepID=UPI0029F51470|nr:DUF4249 family protein [uncultured Acetobacteroides sp.]
MKSRILLWGLLLLASCQLSEDVSVTLPPQQPNFVVEAILRPGMPMELMLLESSQLKGVVSRSYVKDAFACFVLGGDTIKLKYQFYTRADDKMTVNYTSKVLLPNSESGRLRLYIRKGGDTLTAEAQFIKPVAIRACAVDGVSVDATVANTFGDDDRFFQLHAYLYLQKKWIGRYSRIYDLRDNRTEELPLHLEVENIPRDSVKVVVWHISRQYYEYIYTCIRSLEAYHDLYTVPTPIKTNIFGGVGVFTVVAEDKRAMRSVYP